MALSFFPQERPESCVPACVRMVLADFGRLHSEAEIYACCKTDLEGTLARLAAECLASFGLQADALRLTDSDHLKQFVSQARVIAFINLAPLLGINVLHAVIITSIDETLGVIQLLDPVHKPDGIRTWAIGQFQLAWQLARFQTIVITR